MSQQDAGKTRSPAVSGRTYLVFCLLSLGIVFLAQMQMGLFPGNVVVAVVGVLGLISRLRLGPAVFLISLGAAHVIHRVTLDQFRFSERLRAFEVDDVLLCVGVLGYVAGQYRLQSLWNHLFVLDPRRRTRPAGKRLLFFRKAVKVQQQRRPETQVSSQEISLLAISLAGWALLAQVLLLALMLQWNILDLPLRLVRILVVLWALALGFLVSASFLKLSKRRRMSREAALVLLQDVLWQETRGEQRRIQRWLAWRKIKQGPAT